MSTNRFRVLHTMIRVLDLEKSIDFYTRILGMRLLSRQDYPGGEFTLAFVGYGEKSETAVIELTHNWGRTEPYEIGEGFGHVAIGAADIYALCDELKAAGGEVVREPGPMAHGTTHIAFLKDPDGYMVELIQTAS